MSRRSWRRATRGLAIVAGLSVLPGCSDQPYTAPFFDFLPSYKSAQDASPVLLSNTEWWTKFDDPTLNALIDMGLQGSLDLELARERVTEAQAIQRAIPESALLTPRAGLRREGSVGGTARTRAEAALGFDWLLDIYGGKRARIDAAGARIEVADAEVDAARLFLLLNIANAYVDLRFHQTSLRLRRGELASRRETLDLVERLAESDAATQLDVVRARALVSETRAELPEIEAAIAATKNEIAVLLGQVPGTLPIALNGSSRQPRVSLSPEVGIPADLLRNRPDIRVAERSYYAAFREIAGARADLYPRLSLSGTITRTSLSGAQSTDYFFGPSLQFPVLPLASQNATVRQRESIARQAHTQWRLTVLEAIRDVESALGDYAASLTSKRAAEETVRLYTEVVRLTRQLVEGNGATIQELIDAEQNVATANTTLAAALRRVGRSFIALNVSLGSGHAVTGADGKS